jgi:cell division septal protein FtsQ
LYSVKKLNKILIEKFPEILTLDVSRIGLKGISIKIEERKPEALWCKNNQSEDAPECYFVDNTGKVFARAPFFSGNVYFVYKGGLSNEDFLGTQLFNTQDFVNFSSFVKQVSNKLNVKIISAEIKDQGDFDLYLSSGTRIMLNKNISYDDMFNNMEAVLKSAQFSTSTLGSLDYIDMRFGNKVYYKAKSAPKL